MKIIEIETLVDRWRILQNDSIYTNIFAMQGMLQERLSILHRLNELGELSVDGISIVEVLEQTNASLREIDKAL